MSGTRGDNGVESETILRLVNISAGMMDADTMIPACGSLRDADIRVEVVSVNSEHLDRSEEAFMDLVSAARDADLVVMKIHNDPSYFMKYDRLDEVLRRNGTAYFLSCSSEDIMEENRNRFPFGDDDYDLVKSYVKLSGEENSIALIKWCMNRLKGADVDVPEPFVPRAQGLYRPGVYSGIDEDVYLSSLDPSVPTVAVMFNQKYWVDRNLEDIDALIATVEQMGAQTIPLFFISTPGHITGSLGIKGTVERYLISDGRPRVGSVIMASGFSQLSMADSKDEDGMTRNFFEDLGVPVIQAPSIIRSREAWREDTVGMTVMELSPFVIQPEFDGQIISVPVNFTEMDEDGMRRHRYIQDRLDRIASLAIKWARLPLIPPSERKVVIMLNMYPPSNDRLGGAGGLDTFESIRRLMLRMREKGYAIDHIPDRADDIVDELMAALTNDLEWVPENEIPLRAADMLDNGRYMEWLDAEPDDVRNAMCRNWGDPPGEITTYEGKIIIPGVRNGNLFIGIQPNRGHHAHAEQLYHSTDVVMPHQYLAYYRWIRDVFSADILVHMGTHGTLEWLPGKGNGLSRSCYPDAVLDTMPNIYPYIIDDPGEGMEAKRRTNSVLIGYMVPAMTRAESYDDLQTLDSMLQALMNNEAIMQDEKVVDVGGEIYGLVSRLDMWKELSLERDAPKEEVLAKAELLYDYVSEMKDALIKDGLHILGHVPEGRRMEEMVYAMSRLRNGNIPSLRQSVASSRDIDLNVLLDDPSGRTDGKLNGMLLDEIDSEADVIIHTLVEGGFEPILPEEKLSEDLRRTMEFIRGPLYRGITGISDERMYSMHGLRGGFVPPGPSGSPTRGNAHLLPTGRNYYSIDPYSIPSEACWRIGVKMADDAVQRYLTEKGAYPENLGIIVWATDTMKTGGDDIAYILSLMGLKPRWGSYGGRVVGLDVIPLEELGRPRIDVTLRISGMFRDSFPNLVDLIDEAVEIVSGLDESEEDNMIRKHLRSDMAEYIASGLNEDEARSRSLIRIFGDPPGQHGTGTGILIESSKWDTIDDLAQIYTTWGAYAYGRNWKGEKMTDEFVHRMSSLDITVKNHNDREFDLLDIDDDYEVLGGLNAVVRAYGGHKPMSLMGDSSDTDRLKLRTLEEETAFVMRSRVLNPIWFEGLKPHGFRGAMELSKLTEYMLGWDATSDNIEPWMYDAVTEKYILDDENRAWIDENNPYALKEMIEDMLEVIERGMWDAPKDVRQRLRELYLESIGRMEELGTRE